MTTLSNILREVCFEMKICTCKKTQLISLKKLIGLLIHFVLGKKDNIGKKYLNELLNSKL